MADDEDAHRQAERLMAGSGAPVPSMGRGGPFYPPPPEPGAVQWLTEQEREKVEHLIRMEPDLTKIVEGKRAWALVAETAKKIAIWLTAISGGFFVLRELVRGLG